MKDTCTFVHAQCLHLQLQVPHHLRPQQAEHIGGTREVETCTGGGVEEVEAILPTLAPVQRQTHLRHICNR